MKKDISHKKWKYCDRSESVDLCSYLQSKNGHVCSVYIMIILPVFLVLRLQKTWLFETFWVKMFLYILRKRQFIMKKKMEKKIYQFSNYIKFHFEKSNMCFAKPTVSFQFN